MGYFQDIRTCEEHGFVLSPEGTCVRCVKASKLAEKRAAAVKATAACAVALTLLGVTASWAGKRVAHADPAPPPVPTPVMLAPDPAPPVGDVRTETPTHAVLDQWEAEMARADAQRAAELAAKAAAEKQRERAALEASSSTDDEAPSHVHSHGPRGGRTQNQPGTEDHPSWWSDGTSTRPRTYTYGSVAQQQRAMANAGVAPGTVTNPNPGAWLPANNGGNFANRGAAGH